MYHNHHRFALVLRIESCFKSISHLYSVNSFDAVSVESDRRRSVAHLPNEVCALSTATGATQATANWSYLACPPLIRLLVRSVSCTSDVADLSSRAFSPRMICRPRLQFATAISPMLPFFGRNVRRHEICAHEVQVRRKPHS